MKYNLEFTQEELDLENWKPVVGYEKAYMVSDLGRVRKLRGKQTIMLPWKPKEYDYLRIELYNVYEEDEKKIDLRFYRVHRLVAEAFLGEIPKGYHVHHIDGDGLNNRLSNLKIVSAKEHRRLDIERRKESKKDEKNN